MHRSLDYRTAGPQAGLYKSMAQRADIIENIAKNAVKGCAVIKK